MLESPLRDTGRLALLSIAFACATAAPAWWIDSTKGIALGLAFGAVPAALQLAVRWRALLAWSGYWGAQRQGTGHAELLSPRIVIGGPALLIALAYIGLLRIQLIPALMAWITGIVLKSHAFSRSRQRNGGGGGDGGGHFISSGDGVAGPAHAGKLAPTKKPERSAVRLSSCHRASVQRAVMPPAAMRSSSPAFNHNNPITAVE